MGALRDNVVSIGQPVWKQWQVREAARATVLGNQPAKLVLGLLAERADGSGFTHVHRETIVRETGVALRTLQNVLRCLRELGLVEYRRVNQAERIQRGVLYSEEFLLSLEKLGGDLEQAFAVAYAKVQGKGRVGAPFQAKSVAETHVAATENHVAATEKSVAETHPPYPLYGGTSQEHLRKTPTHARSGAQGVLHEASGRVVGQMGVLERDRHVYQPLVFEALEARSAKTGECPDALGAALVANWRAMKAAGRFMAVRTWLGEGHCWHAPVASRVDQAEQRRQADAALGVWRPAEPQPKMSLRDLNEVRAKLHPPLPPVSEEDYARWHA